MTLSCRSCPMVGLLLMLPTSLVHPAAATNFDDLTGRIPSDANTIVVLDVEQLENSPVARQEGWNARDAYAAE